MIIVLKTMLCKDLTNSKNIKYIKKYSEIDKKLFYCEPLKSVLKENLKHEHEVEA